MKDTLTVLTFLLVLLLSSCGANKDLQHKETKDSSGDISQFPELTEFSFEGTIFHYGEQSYDVTSRVEAINSILSAVPVGDKIVIECHVGPKNGVYCIFNTVSESFETDIYGNHLIWHSDDITTAVYSFWSDVYTYLQRSLLVQWTKSGLIFVFVFINKAPEIAIIAPPALAETFQMK